MDIRQRIEAMSKQLLVLAIVTAVLATGGIVTSIQPALDGEAYGYTRLALGIVGLLGAALIAFGSDFGKSGLMVVLAWAAIQSIFYATVPDGNMTRQLIDGLLGSSSQVAINGVITEFSAVGLNLVGLAMLIFAWASRKHVTYWQNRATRGFTV